MQTVCLPNMSDGSEIVLILLCSPQANCGQDKIDEINEGLSIGFCPCLLRRHGISQNFSSMLCKNYSWSLRDGKTFQLHFRALCLIFDCFKRHHLCFKRQRDWIFDMIEVRPLRVSASDLWYDWDLYFQSSKSVINGDRAKHRQ